MNIFRNEIELAVEYFFMLYNIVILRLILQLSIKQYSVLAKTTWI